MKDIHLVDIESYSRIDNYLELNAELFISHWCHLSVIWFWMAGNVFHLGWNGNYSSISYLPVAHGIWDPHLTNIETYTASSNNYPVVITYSGIYSWLYSAGFDNILQIYNLVIGCQILGILCLSLSKLHMIYFEDILYWSQLTCRTVMTCSILKKECTRFYKSMSLNTGSNILFLWSRRLLLVAFDLSNLRLNFHIGVM